MRRGRYIKKVIPKEVPKDFSKGIPGQGTLSFDLCRRDIYTQCQASVVPSCTHGDVTHRGTGEFVSSSYSLPQNCMPYRLSVGAGLLTNLFYGNEHTGEIVDKKI